MNASECLYWLNEIHRYYRRKVIVVWDGLSAHQTAEAIMDEEHPGWFEFHYLPPLAGIKPGGTMLAPREKCRNGQLHREK